MKLLRHRPHIVSRLAATGALALLVLSASAPMLAEAASQGYNVLNNSAKTGMLMSQSANAGVAEPATGKTAASLLGVLSNDTAFDQQPGQVSVQTDGQASTLVSTLNGDIKVGDRIAPSSLAGIGAKAAATGWIVGVAQGNLDSKTKGAVTTTVSDSKGVKHTLYLASIPVVIHVTYYSVPAMSTGSSSVLPTAVQTAADRFAGKHASLLGLVLSFILLITGVVGAGIMLYAAIKGGMDAIARQPLSKVVINQAMLRSLSISALIVFGVLVGALMLLRLL